MLTGPLKDNNKRPAFSGHETFPMRYGWLTKMMDYFDPAQSKEILIDKSKSFLRKPGEKVANLMADFGVGKNMIISIKFWSNRTGVIFTDSKYGMELSEIGKLISKHDRYLDYLSTLWLLHWNLCSNPKQLTAFYYAFNYYTSLEVSRNDLSNALLQLKKDQGWVASADESIKRDVDVLFRTYTVSRNKKNVIAEDSFECPLSELNIIQETLNSKDSRTYQFVIGDKPSLDHYVFSYALNDFWNKNYPNQKTLTIDKITYDFGSPGKIFKIDELSIGNRLSELEHLTNGYYRWTDTTGLNQISRDTDTKFNPLKFLEKTYKEFKRQKVA